MKLTSLARILFCLEGVIWTAVAVLVLTRSISVGVQQTTMIWILAGLMLGNAAFMFLFAWQVLRDRRFLDFFALLVVGINLVMSVTDQVGLFDMLALALNLILLGVLLKELFFNRATRQRTNPQGGKLG
jgi:uncharacterized membrane protein (DUF2068 family)